jgi:AcrR family transcriptional regulator
LSVPTRSGAGDQLDRAAAVRGSLRRLVAESGFHGASMSAVAKAAGVATGTAYVHYESKDELVLAAYAETKRELGLAATAAAHAGASPHERFLAMWLALHGHLRERPEDAAFLVQVEHSPYLRLAHERMAATADEDDPLLAAAAAPDLVGLLAPLPPAVLWELGLAPAVRLVAAGHELDEEQLAATAEACWRAVTRG